MDDDGGVTDLVATSFNDLPIEVSMDILSRLPAKTLVRFSSVRKSFYSLIRTPLFISKHLHFHSSNTSPHLILITPQNLSSGNPCSLLCDDHANTKHAAFPVPPKTKTSTAEVVGSSNGLVCIADRYTLQHAVYLWNPTVWRYKTLPPSCFSEQLGNFGTYAVVGFGFWELACDYRVVRVVYFPDDCRNFMVKPGVEVYSMRENSWRKVEGVVVPRIAEGGSVAFANGALHWLAAKKMFTAFEVVLAFDLKDEVFRELNLPGELVKVFEERVMGLVSFRIKEFGGSVSLFVNPSPGDESCSVWWMKEYGNAKSWTKQFTVVLPQVKVNSLLGITKSGKIIIESYDRKLVSYDPKSKQVQNIVLGDGRYGAHGTFTESLVMLERGKRTSFLSEGEQMIMSSRH